MYQFFGVYHRYYFILSRDEVVSVEGSRPFVITWGIDKVEYKRWYKDLLNDRGDKRLSYHNL